MLGGSFHIRTSPWEFLPDQVPPLREAEGVGSIPVAARQVIRK